jgi:glycosyltransferase involved in cell wall biosynthesis
MIIPESSPELAVSVVVPTRNRSKLLRQLLESLITQNFEQDSFEIIVVDNCSSDDTARMMDEVRAQAACRVTYHPLEKDQGPCHARNVGVQMARGKVVALTDSDCRADRDWLRNGVGAFAGDVAFVSGCVLNKPEQKLRLFSGSYPPVTKEHPTYPACNIFFRRDDFLEFSGFDETLYFRNFIDGKPIECADTDLAWRMKKAGRRNVFAADVIIYHEVSNRKPLNWIVDPFRIFAIPALLSKHPQLRPLLLLWGVFFRAENLLFDLGIVGVVLGVFANHLFLLAFVPYLSYVAYLMSKDGFHVTRIPKLAAQVLLLTARQFFVSAGLLYGSLRFGALVL